MARQVGEPRSEPSGGTIELFGYWQTEAYVPPAAVDGIVPKSDKGTVELLSEHMLPRGCTHIARPRAGAGVVTREAKGGGGGGGGCCRPLLCCFFSSSSCLSSLHHRVFLLLLLLLLIAGRVAKRLGIDYAAAVIGFEYKQGRPFPKIQGIVVPTECAEVVDLAVSVSAKARAGCDD